MNWMNAETAVSGNGRGHKGSLRMKVGTRRRPKTDAPFYLTKCELFVMKTARIGLVGRHLILM